MQNQLIIDVCKPIYSWFKQGYNHLALSSQSLESLFKTSSIVSSKFWDFLTNFLNRWNCSFRTYSKNQ